MFDRSERYCGVAVWLTLLVASVGGAAARGDEPVHRATITGVVRDGTGQPLAGATVLINRTTDAPMAGKGLPRTTTGPDGSYRLVIEFTGDRPVIVR